MKVIINDNLIYEIKKWKNGEYAIYEDNILLMVCYGKTRAFNELQKLLWEVWVTK